MSLKKVAFLLDKMREIIDYLEPEKFGFTEKIGLLSQIATELQIIEITLTSCGTTKINLTKVS